MTKEKNRKNMQEDTGKEKSGQVAPDKNVHNEAVEQKNGSENNGKEEKEEKKESEMAEVDQCKKKIAELEAKLAKEKDDYIRLMADFDNFRRRTSQEKLDLVTVASMDTIKGLLPILDDCERAIAVLDKSTDSEAAKEGTSLIFNKLMGYLKTKGLAVIEAKDKDFDTDMHEAVAQFPVEDEKKKGKVFDVVQTGYTLNGKVVRFAKVVVGI